jgi:type II secretory pathway pseudopilin PulG
MENHLKRAGASNLIADNRLRGFTLIELLVAIGVIMILGGILFLGFSKVRASSLRSEAKVRLANLQSMLAELERQTPLNSVIPPQWRVPPDLTYNLPTNNTLAVDFWNIPSRKTNDADGIPRPFPRPGLVIEGEADRTTHEYIINTAIAMGVMLRMPQNAQAIQKLPNDQLLQIPDLTGSLVTGTKFDESSVRLLLDPWGNPIIFVPSVGMSDVKLADLNQYIITSAGAIEDSSNNYLSGTNGQLLPGSRPFFASAGPDGDFSKGDDNIYSFEN